MKQSNKRVAWIAASLLAASSGFAQSECPAPQKCFEQGHEIIMTQMTGAYNAPSRIDVCNSWDVYADASFTYWQPIQGNMEVGSTNTITPAELNAGIFLLNGNWINMNFDFAPGFKVGLGLNFDYDNWDAYSEYTWFRGHSHVHSNGPTDGSIAASFGHPYLVDGNIFNTASEHWKLHMDFADLELARSYHVGTSLSFRPFIGLRGAWIRQGMHTRYVNENIVIGTPIPPLLPLGTLNTVQKSQSWGVGPRVGLYTNWMFGKGFRIFGNGFGDILYTRYTTLGYNETFTYSTTGAIRVFKTNQRNTGALRTHLDLELGFGWGCYFDNNNWHVDLSAGYGFQVFFDQNMFRRFVDNSGIGNSLIATGNLYVQGLTTSFRFDF